MLVVIPESLVLFNVSVLQKKLHYNYLRIFSLIWCVKTKNMCIVNSKSLVSFDVSILLKTIHTITIKTKNIDVVISESLV